MQQLLNKQYIGNSISHLICEQKLPKAAEKIKN